MKKTAILLSILALVTFVSCEKSDLEQGRFNNTNAGLTIRATVEHSRIAYDVKDNSITPSWTQGDEVFGWDSEGNTFTFTVTEVNPDRNEALMNVKEGTEYTPAEGVTIYAVYYPGKSVDDIADGTLEVDLSEMKGSLDGQTPVLFSAQAVVEQEGLISTVTLPFAADVAIVEVRKFKIDPSENVTAFIIKGANAKGVYTVEDDELKLTPAGEASPISVYFEEAAVSDGEGFVNTPVYVAALPTEGATLSLDAYTENGRIYYNATDITTTDLTAGTYAYMSKRLSPYEALVNGDNYKTVQEAFAAANESGTDATITLLEDCALTEKVSIDGSGSGKITIDLNGKTLDCGTNQIAITDSRVLTVDDYSSENVELQGTITGTSEKGVINVGTSTLNILKGNITGGTTALNGPVYTSSKNAVINMSGGKISADGAAAIYTIGTANLTGGTIYSTNYTANGALVINAYYSENTLSGCEIISTHGRGVLTYGQLYVEEGTKIQSKTYSICAMGGASGDSKTVINGGSLSSQTSSTVYLSRAEGKYNTKLEINGGRLKVANRTTSAITRTSATIPADSVVVKGGLFANPFVTDYVAEGYEMGVNADNQSYDEGYIIAVSDDLSKLKPVASVGGTQYYYSLDKAVSDASEAASDMNVRIENDCWLTNNAVYAPKSEAKLSIDLNGKRIDQLGAFQVKSASTLEFSGDGTLERRDSDSSYVLSASNGGTLNIKGGTYKSVYKWGAVYCNGGTVNVDSGSIVSDATNGSGRGVYVTYSSGNANDSYLIVNGGTFTADTYPVSCYASTHCHMTINGGYFHSLDGARDISAGDGSDVIIKGGRYKNFTDPYEGYVCVGDEVTEGGLKYNYLVKQGTNPIITVNGVGYTSLSSANDAVNDAKEDVSVKLVDDIVLNQVFSVTNATQKVTLDLNGHSMTGNQRIVTNADGAFLTIVDNSTEKSGLVSGGDERTVVYAIKGTIVLSGGKYENIYPTGVVGAGTGATIVINEGVTVTNNITTEEKKSKNAVYASGGNVTINGGTFNGSRGIHAASSSKVEINGGTFTGNGGTGAYFYQSTAVIKGGTFTGDTAVVARFGAEVTINSAQLDGKQYGAYNMAAQNYATKLTFDGNNTTVNGGKAAVYTYSGSGTAATWKVNETIIRNGKFTSGADYVINTNGSSKCDIEGGEFSGNKYCVIAQYGATCNISGGLLQNNSQDGEGGGYVVRSYGGNTRDCNVNISGDAVLRANGVGKVFNSYSTTKTGKSNLNITGGWFSAKTAAGTDDEEDASTSTLFTVSNLSHVSVSGGYFDRHVRSTLVENGKGAQTKLAEPIIGKVGETEVKYTHQIVPTAQ